MWAAEPAHPTWVALGAPWRSDAATCPRCAGAAHVVRRPVRLPDAAGSRNPRPRTGSTATCSCSTASASRCTCDLPGSWNRMNAALALADRGPALRGARSVARSPGSRPSRWCPAGSRPAGCPTGATRGCCSRRTRRAGPRCCAGSQGSDAGVVLAVNAHVADGRDPSWLWDVPYELLRGVPVAASGERALDVAVRLEYGGVECFVEPDPLVAAARLPGAERRHHRVVHPVHPPDEAVVVTRDVDRARRARVPGAARDLRRPRQRDRPGRAVPAPGHRRRARRGRRRARRSPTRSTCTFRRRRGRPPGDGRGRACASRAAAIERARSRRRGDLRGVRRASSCSATPTRRATASTSTGSGSST